MEILMKSYEQRAYPMGHVFKVEVNSLVDFQHLYRDQCADDGKRTGGAEFKIEMDDRWLKYEEFIFKYFIHELRLPQLVYELDLIGIEDENGNYESYEDKKIVVLFVCKKI